MKSLAVTLGCFFPRIMTFTDSGTRTRTSFVIQELKTSVVPMPNATHPTAPTSGVCELLLLDLELRGEIEQAQLLLFLRDDFVKERQMITEEENGGRMVDLGFPSDVVLAENRGHGGDIFVA